MKKLLIYLIPVLAFCLLNITSCKDEAEELPRLFRPSFIASSCLRKVIRLPLPGEHPEKRPLIRWSFRVTKLSSRNPLQRRP